MLDTKGDIGSVPHVKGKSLEFLLRLKESGHPVTLTLNGEAELVVHDAGSYQKLIELAERAEELERTRQSVAEMKAGQGRPAEEMLADMRRILDEKRGL